MFESELPVSNLVKRTILKILNLADASTPLVSNLVKRTILKISCLVTSFPSMSVT